MFPLLLQGEEAKSEQNICEIITTDDPVLGSDDDDTMDYSSEVIHASRNGGDDGLNIGHSIIGSNPYMCELCYSVYTREKSYLRHVRICRKEAQLRNGVTEDDHDDEEEEEDEEDEIAMTDAAAASTTSVVANTAVNITADDAAVSASFIPVYPTDFGGEFSGSSGHGSALLMSSQQYTASLQHNNNSETVVAVDHHIEESLLGGGGNADHDDESESASRIFGFDACIENFGDHKQMSEGQRFLQHLLKEVRRHNKRPRLEMMQD